MATTTLAPHHRPARRPTTGEQPAAAGARDLAAAHLAAGVRDSRRILSEALAAAQERAGREAFVVRMYLGGTLDPRMDAGQVLVEARLMLELGGAGVVDQDVAVEACVALLEGWDRRQQLTAAAGS